MGSTVKFVTAPHLGTDRQHKPARYPTHMTRSMCVLCFDLRSRKENSENTDQTGKIKQKTKDYERRSEQICKHPGRLFAIETCLIY